MTVRSFNLVVPLAHKATDMRATETTGRTLERSGAVSQLIGHGLRQGDVESTTGILPTLLTPAANSAHHSPVTEKDVTGFGSPIAAANSRQVNALRLFCALVRPVFGRPGGEPQGSPVPHRSSNPFGRPPRLEARGAVINRMRRNTMAQPSLIKRRSFPPRPALLTDLPFIVDVKTGRRTTERCYWHVQETDDYSHANNVGLQFAADYAQYLKQNPFWVGSGQMGKIAHDMHCHEQGTVMNGYAVGFWAFIEQLIYLATTQIDHYETAERDAKRTAALIAARDQEAGHV